MPKKHAQHAQLAQPHAASTAAAAAAVVASPSACCLASPRLPTPCLQALSTLTKLVCNVADCGNSVERYRSVKVGNPRFAEAVWDVPGASQILLLVGFKLQGGELAVAADATLGPLQAAAARLRRLADRKGHSGAAVEVKADGDGEGGSGRPPSPFYNTPGFRYQEQARWRLWGSLHRAQGGTEAAPAAESAAAAAGSGSLLACRRQQQRLRTAGSAQCRLGHQGSLQLLAVAALPFWCCRSGTARCATMQSTMAASGCGRGSTTHRTGSTGG